MKNSSTFILFLLFISVFNFGTIFSQKQNLKFDFGRSFNGTGDLMGFHYGITHLNYLEEKQLYWTIGFEGTLHDDEITDYIFIDENNNEIIGKNRYLTSGIQLVTTLGYSILRSTNHDLGFAIGPVLRYQSSSIPDMVVIRYPVLTDLPLPIKTETFIEPMRTLAIGATFRIQYNYFFKEKYSIGFTGGLQLDTNADTISYITFAIGRFF